MNKINKNIEYINITEDYIVLKKPANMKVYGDEEEVLNKLVHKEHPLFLNDKDKFGVIYNIEEEIEGLIILSRTLEFHEQILEIIKKKLFKIKYIGVVSSEKNNKFLKQKDKLTIDKRNKNMEIFYEIINIYNIFNIIAIHTNQHIQYQINMLLNSINAPLVGDKKYGGIEFDTLCLFISEISFEYKKAHLNFSLDNFYKHKINNLLMVLYF